ncbi:sensor histidine kinase [Leifsonia sp. A12D58]|uniref:sensor histidine kinase n=1 Tax=Leifsonia sp. A12D58 TaxID=3397674 RepID=UPI0039DF9851
MAFKFALVQIVTFVIFALGVYLAIGIAARTVLPLADSQSMLQIRDEFVSELRTWIFLGSVALIVCIALTSVLLARLAMRPLRESREARQRFIDSASHELRAPLASIRGELELALQHDRTPQEYRSAISHSLAQAERLGKLTTDLLLLSRGTPESIRMSLQRVSVANVIERVVTQQRAAHPETTISVRVDADLYVTGSEPLLERAIGNLCDNARLYSRPGQVTRLEARVDSSNVLIVVTDDGIGMTSSQLAHATERFWRADTSRTVDGSGLGLALTDDIVQAAGGHLTLTSRPGMGTTAMITLPRLRTSYSQNHTRSR